MKAESGGSEEKSGKEFGSVQQEPLTCPVCGTNFFATTDREFCPVSILCRAFGAESAVTGESGSVSGSAVASTKEADGSSQAWRFENYYVILATCAFGCWLKLWSSVLLVIFG